GANVRGRDLGSVARDVQKALAGIEFPRGYDAKVLGEYQERQAAQQRLLLYAAVALLAIAVVLQLAFGSVRLTLLELVTLPTALGGGILGASLSDGLLSLGTLVGFFTVLGIAARIGILMINHFQHLERYEGEEFGPGLVLRGARERLSPILMTSAATALALVPLVVAGSIAGHEIEHPMAVVILGGLVTSTVLNLFVVPVLYLRFGRRRPPAVAPGAGGASPAAGPTGGAGLRGGGAPEDGGPPGPPRGRPAPVVPPPGVRTGARALCHSTTGGACTHKSSGAQL